MSEAWWKVKPLELTWLWIGVAQQVSRFLISTEITWILRSLTASMRNQNRRKVGGKSYGHQVSKVFAGKDCLLRYWTDKFWWLQRGGRAAKTRTSAKRRQKSYLLALFSCATWMQRHVAQAELMDTGCKNSIIIVPLEKVLTKSEVWGEAFWRKKTSVTLDPSSRQCVRKNLRIPNAQWLRVSWKICTT